MRLFKSVSFFLLVSAISSPLFAEDDWEVVYPWEGHAFEYGVKQIAIYITKPSSINATIKITTPSSSTPLSVSLSGPAGTYYVASITKNGKSLPSGDYKIEFKESGTKKGSPRNFKVKTGTARFAFPTIEYPEAGQKFPKHIPIIAFGGTTDASSGYYVVKKPNGDLFKGTVPIVKSYPKGLKHWRVRWLKSGTFWSAGKYDVYTFTSKTAFDTGANAQETSYFHVKNTTVWPGNLELVGVLE